MAKKKPHKRNLKLELINAAEKRISDGGIGALTLRKLALDTGVTTMATYHHFSNKEALLVQIAVNGFAQLSEMMTADCSDEATPVDNVKSIMRGYFKFALENPAVYHLMFGQEIQGKPLIPEFKKASQKAFYIMANTLKKHLDSRVHELDTEALGLTFWATLHGLVCLVTDGTVLYTSRTEEKLDQLFQQAIKGLNYI